MAVRLASLPPPPETTHRTVTPPGSGTTHGPGTNRSITTPTPNQPESLLQGQVASHFGIGTFVELGSSGVDLGGVVSNRDSGELLF